MMIPNKTFLSCQKMMMTDFCENDDVIILGFFSKTIVFCGGKNIFRFVLRGIDAAPRENAIPQVSGGSDFFWGVGWGSKFF